MYFWVWGHPLEWVVLPGVITLKKTDSPSSSSHQLSIAPNGGEGVSLMNSSASMLERWMACSCAGNPQLLWALECSGPETLHHAFALFFLNFCISSSFCYCPWTLSRWCYRWPICVWALHRHLFSALWPVISFCLNCHAAAIKNDASWSQWSRDGDLGTSEVGVRASFEPKSLKPVWVM